MAFPVVADFANSGTNTGTTSHTINIPARSVDDIIIVYYANYQLVAPTIGTLGGQSWTLLASGGFSDNGRVWWLRSTSSGAATTVTVTPGASSGFNAVTVRITGAHTTTAPAVATSGTNNPPSLNPANWDVEDTLWLVSYSNLADAVSGVPTNYTLISIPAISTTDLATARRNNAVATEDPGAWPGTTNNDGLSTTIGIRPVAGVSGTAVATLGSLTGTASGVETPNITAVAALGGLTGTANGFPLVLGTANASLGGLTASASSPGVNFLLSELGPSAGLAVEIAWGADLNADSSTWVWTDVTPDVRNDPGISTRLGRSDEASQSQPALCTLNLDNSSAKYSLGGHSPNWPYVRKGTPVRVRINPGSSGFIVVFQGFASGFTPSWDSLNGNIPVVSLSASGVIRRLIQGTFVLEPFFDEDFNELATGLTGRLDRLCTENNVEYTEYNTAEALTIYDRMGSQPEGTIVDLLREVEIVDQGQLWDGRSAGISYTTRRYKDEGDVKMTIDAASAELAAPFQPVDDDQRTRNKVDATQPDGELTTEYEDVTGPLGTNAVGVYDDSLEVNVRQPVMLLHYASWTVSLGTVEGYRFPSVTVNLRAAPQLADEVLDVIPGDRIDITNVDSVLSGFGLDTVSLMVEGISHEITTKSWTVTFQCSSFLPWGIARVAEDTGDTGEFVMRADTSSSRLASDYAQGATSISVVTDSGPLWTTVADDYPLWLSVGGIAVRATACSGASSPQTFTVDPLPLARSADDPVKLWNQPPIGL